MHPKHKDLCKMCTSHCKILQNCITLTKPNSSPLKIGRAPKRKFHLPTIHFQRQTCCYFQEGYESLSLHVWNGLAHAPYKRAWPRALFLTLWHDPCRLLIFLSIKFSDLWFSPKMGTTLRLSTASTAGENLKKSPKIAYRKIIWTKPPWLFWGSPTEGWELGKFSASDWYFEPRTGRYGQGLSEKRKRIELHLAYLNMSQVYV